ncbi:helix-turn-helix domain-containing protein [Morganella morganii]|uniref:helix-turn-helix domain-containing protein n=1 Tax=Morganella morganii TaxID=582 RepID=UPI00375152AD
MANSARDQRKISKMSQTQTTELISIKQTTVSDFENKPESTKLGTLFKILAALDLELHVANAAQFRMSKRPGIRSGKGWELRH